MNRKLPSLALGLLVLAAAGLVPLVAVAGDSHLKSTIAFVSTRDNPNFRPAINAAEIYLMDADGTNPQRLTTNTYGDGFPVLSPDGKKLVFDSNRYHLSPEPPRTIPNTLDMFLMKIDDREVTLLQQRGGSASWSPDGKYIAFHRSASGTGVPNKNDAGAATTDSDIFVARVGDAGLENVTNLTDNGATWIDDDPDWSNPTATAPEGRIAFTRHDPADDPGPANSAEIYSMNPDGSDLQQLTFNNIEERSPDWSPDGSRLAFSCRIGGDGNPLEICVMNADGTGETQLTHNGKPSLSPSWSPDGSQIVYQIVPSAGENQIRLLNADGSGDHLLTDSGGIDLSPNWGQQWVVTNG